MHCISTMATMYVPVWGQAIKKLECTNHAWCYHCALEGLVQENPSYKGSDGLTQKMRKSLVSATRSAIRMRSIEENKKKALKKLKHDLQKRSLHCFELHEKCSSNFCKSAKEIFSSKQPYHLWLHLQLLLGKYVHLHPHHLRQLIHFQVLLTHHYQKMTTRVYWVSNSVLKLTEHCTTEWASELLHNLVTRCEIWFEAQTY